MRAENEIVVARLITMLGTGTSGRSCFKQYLQLFLLELVVLVQARPAQDVPVPDIVIQPRDHNLVLGTHGRSVGIMNIAPLEELNPHVLSSAVALFPPHPAVSFNVLEHRDFLPEHRPPSST